MSDNKRVILQRQRMRAYIDGLAHRPRQPSKDELRADLANAVHNTAALPVPTYPHGKTRSEHGGGSA